MNATVICIGNKARGDDGAARRVAELLRGRLPGGVKLISRPQLDIVMAEDASRSDLVVFVDAERREEPPVRITEVAATSAAADAHTLDPGALMALVGSVFGVSPRARLVSVAGPEMPHAEGLSSTAKTASEEAAFVVLDMLRDSADPS